MATINGYITFNGNCREAMAFYRECFGGELTFETVKGSPMESHWPREVHDNILHATLSNGKLTLLGSDMVEPEGIKTGNNITLALICETEDEIESFFQKLSVEGNIKYPLHNFYSGKIGGLKDKYGISWFLKL